MTPDLLQKANQWINQRPFQQKMMVLPDSIREHQHCYSFSWCAVAQKDLPWAQRSIWVGSGRLLISKDGSMADFEGSAPGIDWVHKFELKLQGLEDYWYLEIAYHKQYLGKLKTALHCSTPELLQQLTADQTIVRTESKRWNNYQPSFQRLVNDLRDFGIPHLLEIRMRPFEEGSI